MALLRFFKVPKHQQYEYKPRYWDPKKEELEERLRKAEERRGSNVEASKARISSGFRNKATREYSGIGRRQAFRSNMILIAVIAFLVLLCYLLITVYLPKIVNMVEGTAG